MRFFTQLSIAVPTKCQGHLQLAINAQLKHIYRLVPVLCYTVFSIVSQIPAACWPQNFKIQVTRKTEPIMLKSPRDKITNFNNSIRKFPWSVERWQIWHLVGSCCKNEKWHRTWRIMSLKPFIHSFKLLSHQHNRCNKAAELKEVVHLKTKLCMTQSHIMRLICSAALLFESSAAILLQGSNLP